MQAQPTWEVTLLDWALSALQAHNPSETRRARPDESALDLAYHTCEMIIRQHSKTFYTASSLLQPQKRRAARALYAFCRVTDNIVDSDGDALDRRARLEQWRQLALDPHPPLSEPVALAWADTRLRYGIPNGYAEQLIDGVARDLTQTRYATFDDLAAYAYGVASTVGLMAMHIIGFAGEQALPYAVKLGVALQLTNILRDVGDDWNAGRLYLPLDELASFGLSEADVADERSDQRWQDFMRFQVERTRQLYAEGRPGIALLNRDGRFAIAAAAELYQAILTDIERRQYDVFAGRARVGKAGKARRLPGIWWRSRREY
jgi:phytoene synthase